MITEDKKEYIKREKELIDREFELIELIASIRKEKGLSQRDLSKIIDINQPALARIERHKQSPQINTIIKILNALDYTVEFKKM